MTRFAFDASRCCRLLACVLAFVTTLPASDNAPASPSSAESTPAKPASEIDQLKALLAEQQRQINELRTALAEQGKLIERGNQPAPAPAPAPLPANPARQPIGEIASTTPVLPPIPEPASKPVFYPNEAQDQPKGEPSPLQLKIGDAYITPVGFMDFTAVFRDVTTGSNIGTSFGSFPYRTAANALTNLSEIRESPQNSRIGVRVDADVKGAKVIGYMESDFLGGVGNPPVGNVAVSSDSYPLRLRLYWADVRKDKWEILGGQTWSLLTPNRSGISPLPGDIFFSQAMDVNYLNGLTWGRIPEFRFVYHPSDIAAVAFAVGNPEQYIGGSGGGSTITLPSAYSTSYANQLSNGTLTLSTPNFVPDILGKIAFDPKLPNGNAFHFEVGGVVRTFKVYDPAAKLHHSTEGGGVTANMNIELVKGFRFITNNYYSSGGGRYIFGQAPDVVVNGDGSLSTITSKSTTTGFEWLKNKTMLWGYYGGVYIDRSVVIDPSNNKLVGYGYTGSSNSQNRAIQEATLGFTQTMWKDPKYGALSLIGQYAYFTRDPWYVASGTPKDTHMNEVWLDLRYTLPGSAPTIK